MTVSSVSSPSYPVLSGAHVRKTPKRKFSEVDPGLEGTPTLISKVSASFSKVSLPKKVDLLRNYKLGFNALRYSKAIETIYSNLPEFTSQELADIGEDIEKQLKGRLADSRIEGVKNYIKQISPPLKTPWADQFLRMLIAVKKEILRRNDPSEIEIMRSTLEEIFSNCSNRKSVEIERLYFNLVAPSLNSAYLLSLTPTETLAYEFAQHRNGLAEKIINKQCPDQHNAASHNFFRRTLNASVFFLPPSPLSQLNLEHDSFAMKNKEKLIRKDFQIAYHSSKNLYDVFTRMLYPRAGENFLFKPEMFTIWLKSNGKMNADSFIDDDLTVYRPEVVVAFLEEHKFLKKRPL